MSIGRFALRTATVRALTGRTLAGAHVRDSEIGAIEDSSGKSEHLPFILVYTDESHQEPSGIGSADLIGGATTQHLCLEIGVTTKMTSGKHVGTRYIPGTDAGMELKIDTIERQIRLALVSPSSPWGDLWTSLVRARGKFSSQRGEGDKAGHRFAARRCVWELTLLDDPQPGAAPRPGSVWARFLALAEADADLSAVAPLLADLITGGATDWTAHDRLRAAYGLSAADAAAIVPVGMPL